MDTASDKESDPKAVRDAVVTETNIFTCSTRDGTFDNNSLEDYYAPIESYEGRHRYDPKFEWDSKEEKRVVRKVRLREHHPPRIRWKLADVECRLTGRSAPGYA